MAKKTTNEFPDFGELNEAFGIYKAAVRQDPLVSDDALDRMFAEAPMRARAIRRVRLQWALTFASIGIVTAALIVTLGQNGDLQSPHSSGSSLQLMPPQQSPVQTPRVVSDTPSGRLTAPKHVSQVILPFNSSVLGTNPKYGSQSVNLVETEHFEFRVSAHVYPCTADIDSAVAHDPALGPGWRAADWIDLVGYTIDHPIQELIDSLHWTVFDTLAAYPDLIARDQFWIRYKGRTTLERDTVRHFFVARFHHHVPSTWKVHANLDNNEIAVGSWNEWHFPVLAVRRQAIH